MMLPFIAYDAPKLRAARQLSDNLAASIDRCLAKGDSPQRILASARVVAALYWDEPDGGRLVERVETYLMARTGESFAKAAPVR